ncbi:hypothetical protein ACFXAZ_07945 [Streptomyces sp. NPDC059477]|uniref:hypothetical protein n=1 Tax=Streptomyces sp. NPDC059477 TaxID=3346847 RepID=UPI0036756478
MARSPSRSWERPPACPLVTKVHNEARRFADEGYDILLIGQQSHDEVVGTTGQARTGSTS